MLVRVLPPLAFAVIGYPLIGLNASPDNQSCLLWFAGILVRVPGKDVFCWGGGVFVFVSVGVILLGIYCGEYPGQNIQGWPWVRSYLAGLGRVRVTWTDP